VRNEAKISKVNELLSRPEMAEWIADPVAILDVAKEIVEAINDSGLFYHLLECENCDEEIYEGVACTTLEHKGLPAIPFDMASQTNFHCGRCGADNYTGDFDVMCEGGDEPDDDIDDEDDEPAGGVS
jgi:hypothetical protein